MNVEIIYSEVNDELAAVKAYMNMLKANVKWTHADNTKVVTMLFQGHAIQGFRNIVNLGNGETFLVHDNVNSRANSRDKTFIEWSHKVLEELVLLNARFQNLSERVDRIESNA